MDNNVPLKNGRGVLVRCDCGTEKSYLPCRLANGNIKSCGCLKRRLGSDNPAWTGCGEIGGAFWSSILNGARDRNLDFTVTIEDALAIFVQQNRRCVLSGVPLNFSTDSKRGGQTASFDRIDSSGGYVPGNVQWVHKMINIMKYVTSMGDFIDWCHKVSNTHPRPII